MEGSGLERGEAFADERQAAVDEAGFFGAVLEGLAGDGVVVGLRRAGRGWRCRRRGSRPFASSSGGRRRCRGRRRRRCLRVGLGGGIPG